MRKIFLFVIFFFIATFSFSEPPYWYKTQLNTGVYGNCGPTCVAMAIQYATTLDFTVEKIRDEIRLTLIDNYTDFDELKKKLKHHSVPLIDIELTNIFNIDSIIWDENIVIVLVNLDVIPSKANRGRGLGNHYFIISGVQGNNFIVQDPYNGPDVLFNRDVVWKALVTTRSLVIYRNFNIRKTFPSFKHNVDKWER